MRFPPSVPRSILVNTSLPDRAVPTSCLLPSLKTTPDLWWADSHFSLASIALCWVVQSWGPWSLGALAILPSCSAHSIQAFPPHHTFRSLEIPFSLLPFSSPVGPSYFFFIEAEVLQGSGDLSCFCGSPPAFHSVIFQNAVCFYLVT